MFLSTVTHKKGINNEQNMHPDPKRTLAFREWPPRARLVVKWERDWPRALNWKGFVEPQLNPSHGATRERQSWDKAVRWKGFAKPHKNQKRSKTHTLHWCRTPTEDAPLRSSHKPQHERWRWGSTNPFQLSARGQPHSHSRPTSL